MVAAPERSSAGARWPMTTCMKRVPQPPPAGPAGGRSRLARRVARTAALGGGGLTLLGATGVGVLVAEASLARRWIEPRMPFVPKPDGRYTASGRVLGRTGPVDRTGDPIVLVTLGDSCAAGVGADGPGTTPGALLATGIAELSGRPVELRCYPRPGGVTAELDGQIDRMEADDARPDCVLIIVGGNDIRRRTPQPVAVRQLRDAVLRLRVAGSEVVVGTVPDLGAVAPVHEPLRSLGARWSRQLAAAQTVAVLEAGGRTVSLGDLLAPDFHAQPEVMFSPDRFHPSSAGYRRTVGYLLPAMAAALGLSAETADGSSAEQPSTDDTVDRLEEAAAEAVQQPGTEIRPAGVAERLYGPAGRWVRRLPLPRVPGRRAQSVTDG